MIRGRTQAEVARHDLWKLIVLALLGIFTLLAFIRDESAPSPVPFLVKGVSLNPVGTILTLSGTAPAGTTVEVHPGIPIAVTQPDGLGNWSLGLDGGLMTDRPSEVKVIGPDKEVLDTFKLDSNPVFLATRDKWKRKSLKPSRFALNEPSTGASWSPGIQTIRGEAPMGVRVTVDVDGVVVCSALAGENGKWDCEAEVLQAGSRKVRVVGADGQTGEATVSVEGGAAVTQRREITYPLPGSKIQRGSRTLYGWAKPGEYIRVTVGRHLKGIAIADKSGRWKLDTSLMRGRKVVTARIGSVTRTAAYLVR